MSNNFLVNVNALSGLDPNPDKPALYGFYDQYKVRSIVQKPIKYVENMFGQAIRHDVKNRNMETEMSFWPKFGKERLNTGNLPYSTTPRLNSTERPELPIDTRVSRVCWNEAVAQAGPYYLRHWPLWDGAPFQPSIGDVSKDPRFGGSHTRQFTQQEKFYGR